MRTWVTRRSPRPWRKPPRPSNDCWPVVGSGCGTCSAAGKTFFNFRAGVFRFRSFNLEKELIDMWTCAKNRKHLNAYMDGELPDRARSEVERHLARCPACLLQLDGLRGLASLLRNDEVPPVPVGPDNSRSGFPTEAERSRKNIRLGVA